jgi:FkbM family methyltransferase
MKITTNDISYGDLSEFELLLKNIMGRTGKRSAKDIEDSIFNRPKYRRSFGPLLTKTFFNIAKFLNCADFFEIGVMNGRHTNKILQTHSWIVHSFEPNLYCYPVLVPLLSNDRLNLIPFAVSDKTGFAEFHLPTKLLGRDLNPMSGISSLNKHLDSDASNSYIKSQLVATITGVDYLKLMKQVNPESLALWIDTEGSGASVLKGFGSELSRIPVLIIEVEYGRHFSSSPNWNSICQTLKDSGFEVVARDWQTEGQCNLLCLGKGVSNIISTTDIMNEYKQLAELAP